jgi:Rps23 Pro-64 3,4-dihydroxylase Tpa1-like proline 4-hydroxylase
MDNQKHTFLDSLKLLEGVKQLCRQRLEKDAKNPALLRSLAEVCRKLGDLEEAAAVYDRLVQIDPHDAYVGYLSAVFGDNECSTAPKGTRAAPFVYRKNFLPPELHNALLPFVLSVQEQFVPMLGGNGAYQPESHQALQFPGKWGGPRFRNAIREILPSVLPRFYLPPFEAGGIELVLRAYQHGHFFKIHRDAPPGSTHANRMLNFVYYFHRIPRPYAGGELILFDSDFEAGTCTQSHFTRVVPEDNALVIFPCNFFHCVLPMRCSSKEFADSRFVINGHVQARAAFETDVRGGLENPGEVATSFGS